MNATNTLPEHDDPKHEVYEFRQTPSRQNMPNPADAVKLLAVLLTMMSVHAGAQEFPARNVRFIVPQVPGGATDVFARAVGQKLGERWGRTVVVENRGGAGGTLGTDVVAKSTPDGHTLLVTYAGSQAINQSLFPKLSYVSVKDFQTVATLAVTPFLLIVNNSLPAKSLKEFLALARGRPGVMAYASSGNGSVNHLLGVNGVVKVRNFDARKFGVARGLARARG